MGQDASIRPERVESKKAAEAQRSPSGSQTLLRGLDVLEGVAEGKASLGELAAQVGLTRSTTHRLANALMERRYLSLTPGQGYHLGPKLLELGYFAQQQADIVAIAKPVLAALVEKTGLPAFLGARDSDQSVNLFSVAGRQRVAVITPVGTRRNLAETSLGKALMLDDSEAEWKRHFANVGPAYRPADWLAMMRQCAARGVVVHAGPPPDHVRAVAAPARDSFGQIVAAVSTVTVSQYMEIEDIAKVAPLLEDAAQKISAELGYRQAASSPSHSQEA